MYVCARIHILKRGGEIARLATDHIRTRPACPTQMHTPLPTTVPLFMGACASIYGPRDGSCQRRVRACPTQCVRRFQACACRPQRSCLRCMRALAPSVCVCVYVCVCMKVCAYVMYVYLYVYVNVCIHMFMHACMRVHMFMLYTRTYKKKKTYGFHRELIIAN